MKFEDYEYIRPNIKEIEESISTQTTNLVNAKNIEEARLTVENYFKIYNNFDSMYTLCYIRNSLNTTDSFYELENDFFDNNSPVIESYFKKYEEALLNTKFKDELKGIYGEYFFEKLECSFAVFSDKIIDELVTESKLVSKYEKLQASAKIPFDGKILNLSQVSKYTQNEKRETRLAAHRAVAKFYEDNQEAFNDIYSSLLKVRDKMAKKMGYENYVDFGYLRLGRTDYKAKDVASYRCQIEKSVVPVATKIINEQAKRIKIDNLQNYDLSLEFLDGNPTPKGSEEELLLAAKKMYGEMSPETKEFFDFMLDHSLLDLKSKAGKVGGGYSTNILNYKSPYIFANFNGTKHDVEVLTHEAGHAFQGFRDLAIYENPYYISPTYEACEIHSMSMEFFAYPWLELFFKEDTKKYKFSHLRGGLTFIPYGASIDEFQHFVYENPNCTTEQRNEKWRNIEKKYTPYEKYDDIPFLDNGSRWMYQGHIFSDPFYYIDYTLAQVCALNFYLLSLENNDLAWQKYIKLCDLGGSASFLKLLKKIGFDNPFEDGFLDKMMAKVDKLL